VSYAAEERLFEILPELFRECCEVCESLRGDSQGFWMRLTDLVERSQLPPEAGANEQCFICHSVIASCLLPCGHVFCRLCAQKLVTWHRPCPFPSCGYNNASRASFYAFASPTPHGTVMWDDIIHYRFLSMDAFRPETFLSRDSVRAIIRETPSQIKNAPLVFVSFIGLLNIKCIKALKKYFSSHPQRNSPTLQFFFALASTNGGCFTYGSLLPPSNLSK